MKLGIVERDANFKEIFFSINVHKSLWDKGFFKMPKTTPPMNPHKDS